MPFISGRAIKRFVVALASFVLVAIAVVYIFRGSITAWLLKPQSSIVDQPLWSALDYQQISHWRAAPDAAGSDWQLSFDDGFSVDTRLADVFYIHPTTYFSADAWNSPMQANSYSEQMLNAMMLSQASAFAECCDVWAPKYREATIYAFFDETMSNGTVALDRAYVDVSAAFEYFLSHRDSSRPFIIASHSQGSAHAMRLLHDYVDNTDLANQLVAAYVLGYSLSNQYLETLLPEMRVCESAHDQGCIIHWDSALPEGRMSLRVPQWTPEGWILSSAEDAVCVNPVSWRNDQLTTAASQHLGALSLNFRSEFAQAYTNQPMPVEPTVGVVLENAFEAQCANGLLRVGGIGPESIFMNGVSEDRRLHLLDYNLFWLDIRRNALERVLLH